VSTLASSMWLINSHAGAVIAAAAIALPGIAGSTAPPIADRRPNTAESSANLFDTWVRLPPDRPQSQNTLRQMVVAIRAQTGWSQRHLASVLNTTHPTVSSIEQGRLVTRVKNLATRVAETARVVERIHMLAARNPEITRQFLEIRPVGQESSADEHLRRGDSARAYLTALEAVNPSRASDGLTVGEWPSTPGRATVALITEEPE
jgi:transcriptional regulator with XRE-family HTH domain